MRASPKANSGITPPQVTVLLMTLGVCAFGFYSNRAFYHDDAYITLRYVGNFLDQQGIVWNPQERVEGYTNFLHLLLISFFGQMGVALPLASQVVNALALLLLLLVLAIPGLNRLPSDPSFNHLPLIFTAGSFPIIIWTLGGLETVLFTMFLTVGICLVIEHLGSAPRRSLALASLAFALASTTRIDGLLFFGLSFVWILYHSTAKKPVVIFALTFGAIFLSYFGWRLAYYNSLFPNTFYVKTGGFDLQKIRRGMKYVLGYAQAPPFLFPGTLLAVGLAIWRRRINRRIAYLCALIATYLGYIIYVGGDHMQAYRFIVPLIPATAILLSVTLAAFDLTRLSQRALLLSNLAIVLLLWLQPIAPKLTAARTDQAAYVGEIIGRYIDREWPEQSLVALNTAGSTPYYAPNNIYIDMLGLNDAHIARRTITQIRLPAQNLPGHAKGDGAYVLARRPDFIILGVAEGSLSANPIFLSDLEIAQDPRFAQAYRMRQVALDVSGLEGYGSYNATRSGTLTFTYYELVP